MLHVLAAASTDASAPLAASAPPVARSPFLPSFNCEEKEYY